MVTAPFKGEIDIDAHENKTETLLDAKPGRRQGGAMAPDSKVITVGSLDRINVRLQAETFGAMDARRARRTGVASRKTWMIDRLRHA